MLDCNIAVFVYVCVFASQQRDDEAVVDTGGTRFQQGSNFEQEDLEGILLERNHTLEARKAAAEREPFLLTALSVGERRSHQ